jgi:DNA-binding transcriptional ArsR family regulator
MKGKLNPLQIKEMAEYFKVLSEESRLKILNCLCDGAKNVTQITEDSELEQANVSRHLKILTQAGVLTRQTEGVNAYYAIANKKLFNLCDLVCKELI